MVLRSLDNEAFPFLGSRVISTNAVFRYGIHKGYCSDNPALGKNEYLPARKVQHMAHLSLKDLPQFLEDLENYVGDIVCKSAVQFTLLTHARTDEIRFSEWEEIDFENAYWSIPAKRMKMNIAQTIPLSTQAIEILKRLKLITGQSKYIFASLVKTDKPISENGMLSVIYRMGYKGKATVHGFRGTYSTIANEVLKFRPDVVEASLAHKVKDPVRGAYNHATYLEERQVNAQVWSDFLSQLVR